VASFTVSALTLWMLGFPDRALARANRAVTLATELEHPFTLAYALFHTGFLHLWRREPELARDRAVGLRAEACARAGRAGDGIALIDEAIEIAGKGSGLTLLPEFYLLKGELLLLVSAENGAAEAWFQRAFDIAGDLDARMSQLRAAMGLCRSQQKHGDPQQGARLLSAVYARFTEGFTIPDLTAAAELLESLHSVPERVEQAEEPRELL